jgi:hypothetical protein
MRKYTLYAIGEIALVVIGILIALSINNWNEERKKDMRIKNQLLNLSKALEQDITGLNLDLKVNAFRYYSFQYLRKLAGIEVDLNLSIPIFDSTFIWQGPYPDTFNRSFIEESFSWFDRGMEGIRIHKSALDEFRSNGLFSEIDNDELKDKIYDYYDVSEWRLGERAINHRIDEGKRFHYYLRDEFGIDHRSISNLQNPIQFLSSDKGALIRLERIVAMTSWTCRSILLIMDMANELIESIEIEVSDYK